MSWADTQKGIRLSMADLFCRFPGLRYCSGHLGRSSVPLASSNASSPPRRCFRQTKIAQRRYFAATLSFLFQVYYDSLIPPLVLGSKYSRRSTARRKQDCWFPGFVRQLTGHPELNGKELCVILF